MELRDRHFGPIFGGGAADNFTVDVGALVRRLLLFEECILESVRLLEIPSLANVFGFEGLITLIKDPCFRIICDALVPVQTGQTADLDLTATRGGVLPIGSYHFALMQDHSRKDYLHSALQHVHEIPGLKFKQALKLKKALADRLLEYPEGVGSAGGRSFEVDLKTQASTLYRSLELTLRTVKGIDAAGKLKIDVTELSHKGDYRVDTNLPHDFSLTEQEAHHLVERALLGVASLNQTIELMRSLEAVTGFRENDLPVLEAKLSFLFKQLDPETQERQFERVIALSGLPSLKLSPDARVDIDRLLELRSTAECKELRSWLRTMVSEPDEGIQLQFSDIGERLRALAHGTIGKALRLVITTAVGFVVPPIGSVSSVALSTADTFLYDRFIKRPGPITFLGKRYPSIFRD